jgi:hypothetical protein
VRPKFVTALAHAPASAYPDEVGEVTRDRLLGLGHHDPALLGQRRRVDVVDLLLGVAGQDAVEDGDREQAVVAVGEAARNSTRRGRSSRLREGAPMRPMLAQGQVGPPPPGPRAGWRGC